MPTFSEYGQLLLVNIGFVVQIALFMYLKSAADIRKNWIKYRCNPSYWIFSTQLSEDFTYCVQTSQTNMMGYLLQPLQYMTSSLTTMGGNLGESINNLRLLFSSIRNFVGEIIQNVFGVFLNLIIEFQKMVISIKDMVGKMIGIVTTIMYVLDGSLKTMNSTWSGPPGQMVKAIGSCFHPDTLLTLADGQQVLMQDVPLNATLADGAHVFAKLDIHNVKKERMYTIPTLCGSVVQVTGDHFILDKTGGPGKHQWTQVKHYCHAIPPATHDPILDHFCCLITTNRRIAIDGLTFWDWEDDELVANA